MLRSGLIIGLVVGIGLLSCVGVGIVIGELSRPERYEFPDGFRGHVVVRYRDPTCPPLPTDGLYRVITIPMTGQSCTSSDYAKGWVYERFEYKRPDGQRISLPAADDGDQRVMVWDVGVSENQGQQEPYIYQSLFVGTRAEFEGR